MVYLPYHLLVLYSSEAEHFLTVYVYADLPTLPPTRTLKHLVPTSFLRISAILGLLLVDLTTKWSSIPQNLSTSWPSMMTYLPLHLQPWPADPPFLRRSALLILLLLYLTYFSCLTNLLWLVVILYAKNQCFSPAASAYFSPNSFPQSSYLVGLMFPIAAAYYSGLLVITANNPITP